VRVLLVSLARRGGMLHFLLQAAQALEAVIPLDVLVARDADTRLLHRRIRRFRVATGRGTAALFRGINPLSWLALWRSIRESRPALVHIVGVHEWNPIVAVLTRGHGLPLVYTVHDPEAHEGAPFSIRVADWLTLKLANELIVLTRVGRQQLIARGLPPNRIHIIPHGLYTIFVSTKKPDLRPARRILYFGRFVPYKGLDVLIDAFREIQHLLPGWKLVLAGTGPLPDSLAGGTNAGIEVRNRYIPDRELSRLMQRASFVVVPYTSASQSGVVATAYAFGKPVISTSVGGLREMVVPGRTGLLVPGNDAISLARAMEILATKPQRLARLGRSVRSLAPRRWGWPRIARQHLALYSATARRAPAA
jgi:starch synthase